MNKLAMLKGNAGKIKIDAVNDVQFYLHLYRCYVFFAS